MKSLLIGESASPDVQRAIVAAIEESPLIEQVIHLRTLHVGPESVLVAAKVAVRRGELAESIAASIDEAERRIRAAVPIAGLIYLEPDLYEAAREDASDPAVSAVRTARGEQRPDDPAEPEAAAGASDPGAGAPGAGGDPRS